MMAVYAYGQRSTSIENIRENPGRYVQESVSFQGIVQHYVRGTATTTSYYMIRGDYGGNLRVNTSAPSPQINSRYQVTGTVIMDGREPLVIEINKRLISPVGDTTTDRGESIQTPPPPPPPSQDNTSLIVILVIALVVIGGVVVFFLTRPKPEPAFMQEPGGAFDDSPTIAPSSTGAGAAATVVMNKGEDYQTIKFEPSVPPTMKFIPGKLEILNGPDKGKTLMLAGYPTPDGSMASIGRDHQGWETQAGLSGGKKFAHVRIKDDSRTLSRMQAEIIYRNGKIYLKNLSSVNPSQVDGYDVPVNEVAEVKPGSKISTGFIEFRYQQK